MTARATLSADGRTFTLSKGMWSRVFPVEKLSEQIRFYRGLCETPPSKGKPSTATKCAWAYLPTLNALQDLARKIETQGAA